jgi:hypothetical protein
MVKSGKPTPDDKIEIHGDVFDQVIIFFIYNLYEFVRLSWLEEQQIRLMKKWEQLLR